MALFNDQKINEGMTDIVSHFRGTFTTLVALQTAIPTGNAGDEAIVDGGIGQDAKKYIWDVSDSEWIEGGGGASTFATLTGNVSDNAALQSALDGKVAQTITNGVTTSAPSQDAVFDALELKLDKSEIGTPLTQNFTYNSVTHSGQRFTLSQTPTDTSWVTVQGVQITDNVDYIVEDNILTIFSSNVVLIDGNSVGIKYYYGGLGAAVNVINDSIISPSQTWSSTKIRAATLESLGFAFGDETSSLTVGTNKVSFRMPYAFTLMAVRVSLNVAPTGSTAIFNLRENGTSVLSTNISIDAGEFSSTTASVQPVISDSSLADDALMTVDNVQIGSTIAGAGPKIYLIGYKS